MLSDRCRSKYLSTKVTAASGGAGKGRELRSINLKQLADAELPLVTGGVKMGPAG